MTAVALPSLAVVSWLLVCGCGEQGAPRTLTANDVSGLPPGDATGALFSGTYMIVSSHIDDCYCRSSSCARLISQVGELSPLTQQDGRLTMTNVGGPTYSGGVNEDGKFWCGGGEESDDLVSYGLVNGQFHLAGGRADSFVATNEGTLTETVNGEVVACDIRTGLTARYQGP